MLKATVTDEEVKVTASGSTVDILEGVAYIIAALHTQMKSASPGKAMAFRRLITELVANEGSPLWNDVPGEGVAIIEKD